MLAWGSGVLEAVAAHAERAYPEEACGLLLGTGGEVLEARPVPNVHPSPRERYRMDPEAVLRIEREAAARGLRTAGAYHSHPDGEALPSETDREDAAAVWGTQESWPHLLIPVRKGKAGPCRAWVLRSGTFAEVPLRAIMRR